MRTMGRKSLMWMMACLLLLTAAACSESPAPSTPALRLVERGLRREFNTRYITVTAPTPDTVLVAVRGGRLMRGVRGPNADVRAEERATIARRALELLAPNPADTPSGLRSIVVEIDDSKRFGPLVFGRRSDRSRHDVRSLLATRADSAATIGGPLGGSLQPAIAGDSVR